MSVAFVVQGSHPTGNVPLDLDFDVPPFLRVPKPTPCWGADPELFFPLKYNMSCREQIERAKTICAECPIRTLCLEWAVARPDLEGIWAGTTPMERRRLRNRR